jgi:hypothetical protein
MCGSIFQVVEQFRATDVEKISVAKCDLSIDPVCAKSDSDVRRDAMPGVQPFWLQQPAYVYVTSAAVVVLFRTAISRHRPCGVGRFVGDGLSPTGSRIGRRSTCSGCKLRADP